jgi:hypothetical protein
VVVVVVVVVVSSTSKDSQNKHWALFMFSPLENNTKTTFTVAKQ